MGIKARVKSTAISLVSLEIYVVALCVAASIALERVLPIALAVAGCFCLIRWQAYARLSVRTPADWGVGVLLLTVPVTLWATALPETTRPNVYRLLAGIALYYTVVNWVVSSARARLVTNGMVLVGLGLAFSAPFIVQWGGGKLFFIPTSVYTRFPQLFSDTVNANVVAGYFLILLLLPLGLLLFGWRKLDWLERVFMIGASLLLGVMLLLTQSRGAIIGFGAALALMGLLYWPRSWLPLLGLAAVGGFMVQSIGIATVLDAVIISGSLTSFEARVEIWSRAIYMMQDFPFTGVGLGSFGPVMDLLYPLFLIAPGNIPHAHQLFLQVGVDVGIPGLIGWLAILTVVLMSAWPLYRHGRMTGDGWIAGLGAGLLCSQVAMIVHGLTDAVTWAMARPSPIVWGIWGLTIAAWRVLVVKSAE